MRKHGTRFAMLAVALFAMGALTFGATEVLAKDAKTACWYDPPNMLGECSSQTECQAMCDEYSGTGDCRSGCCDCML